MYTVDDKRVYLDKFAFIAGGQLLNVAHGLVLRDGNLVLARPQHRQSCSTGKQTGAALSTRAVMTGDKHVYDL